MKFDYDGDACASYSAVGLAIAEQVPIVGTTATNKECERRAALVLGALDTHGLPTDTAAHPKGLQGAVGPNRSWYTVWFDDDKVGGVWADSAAEAIIECALWHARPVVRVFKGQLTAKESASRSIEVMLF